MPSEEPARIILVEGEDDEHVVEQLRRKIGLPEFAVHPLGGKDKVIDTIGPGLLVDGREVLGILIDADDSVVGIWSRLVNEFAEGGIDLPPQPAPEGLILYDHHPRIGVWLMPDNQSGGELEDFIETMIPEDDTAWLCAEEYIECIPSDEREFKAGKRLKAKVHSWLATREIPGRAGAAIGAGDLSTDGELAQRFIRWLDRLFG